MKWTCKCTKENETVMVNVENGMSLLVRLCFSTEFQPSCRWYNSSYGRPGRSLEPPGMHLLMTSSPNMASLASFTHRSRTFASVAPCPQRCLYFLSTVSTSSSLFLLISEEGSAFSFATFLRGRGRGLLLGVSTDVHVTTSDGLVSTVLVWGAKKDLDEWNIGVEWWM